MTDDSDDPLTNPNLLWACREDPALELAIREKFPAAGGGDKEWLRSTQDLAHRMEVKARLAQLKRRMEQRATAAALIRAFRELDAFEAAEREAGEHGKLGGDPVRWLH